MITLLTLMTASAPAVDWEKKYLLTEEHVTLVVEKASRMMYSMRIISPVSANNIDCAAGVMGIRNTQSLAMLVRTAAARSASDTQVGPVLSYDLTLADLTNPRGPTAEMAMFGAPLCAGGIDAYPGTVVFTLGSMYKNVGRTATVSQSQAEDLANWLLAN